MQKILDWGMTVMQIKVEIAICVSILNFWINLFDECVTSSVYENSVNFDEGVRPGLFDMMQKWKESTVFIICRLHHLPNIITK